MDRTSFYDAYVRLTELRQDNAAGLRYRQVTGADAHGHRTGEQMAGGALTATRGYYHRRVWHPQIGVFRLSSTRRTSPVSWKA